MNTEPTSARSRTSAAEPVITKAPPTRHTRPTRSPRRVYRLTLYGTKSSGKTCILTALALPRNANPGRLTCTWIEETPEHPLPAGNPADWKTKDPYHLGWRWLNEQRKRLIQGDVPATNPIHEPTRLLYDFTAPEQGTIRVELTDYSGELIRLTSAQLASQLRSHMQTCDGILVLAETPHPGADLTPLSNDLEILKGAFSLLLSEHNDAREQDWPVALLLNKWDRRGPISFTDPDGERARAEEFLAEEPSPPHRPLAHAIENAVTPRNMRLFPVSAFGAHLILSDGREIPNRQGSSTLHSFGLEDPFLWAASRKDEIDVDAYELAASATSWWQFWQLVLGRSADKTVPPGRALLHAIRGVSPFRAFINGLSLKSRLPKNSTLVPRVIAARRRSARNLAAQASIWLILFVCVFLIGETALDGVRYRSLIANRQKPDATPKQLIDDEDWLQNYYRAPWFHHSLSRHLVLKRDKARTELEASRTRRDNQSWASVTAAPPELRKERAEAHLKEVGENSSHRTEAEQIRDESTARTHRLENHEFLETIAREVEALAPPQLPTEEQIRPVLAKLNNVPHPDSLNEDADGLSQKSQIESTLFERIKEAKQRDSDQQWAKFQGEFYNLLNAHKIIEAAAKLEEGRSRFPVKDLEADFATRAVASIEEVARGKLKSRLWTVARTAVSLPLKDPRVAELLSADQIRKLRALNTDVDSAEDADLYNQIIKFRPQCRDQISAYLRGAPDGRMRKEVEAYQAYLAKIDGPLDLKLTLSRIDWGEKCWNGWDHEVQVKVDGRTLIESTAKAKKNDRTGKVGKSASIRKRLDDGIRLEIVLMRPGSYNPFLGWTKIEAGRGAYHGAVSGLNGHTIELSTSKPAQLVNWSSFMVEGIPREPTLPTWRQK